jgi:hypothetical protein
MKPIAYSIEEFCKAQLISRAMYMYYKLDQQGHAPRLMRVGPRHA